MISKRYYSLLLGALMAFFMLPVVHAQSEWSLNAGSNLNTGFTAMDVGGFGPIVSLEYMPAKDHFFSLELRTKYDFYFFNDGSKWATDEFGNKISPPINKNEARLDYNFFTPRIGLAPKLHLRFNKPVSLFLENEFDIGLMTGKAKYIGFDEKKKITEPIYCYSVGVGFELNVNNNWDMSIIFSMGYSTLNFKDNIVKHKPIGFQTNIPNQRAPFYCNIIFKFPLKN